jgi:CobQ-like glutamine amidotransferase family enzyme
MKIIIGWLYPDLMSTYGDRGNIICLTKRCQWRDIDVQAKNLTPESSNKDFTDCDIIIGGGAQDRQQGIVIADLLKRKKELAAMLEDGKVGLFVCGSPQLLGHYYETADQKKLPGLGIFDMATHSGFGKPRLIGNLVAKTDLGVIVGFENHSGRTYLGNVKPFGKVLTGFGNNGQDKTEGAWYKNCLATYSHGPLLPKNPHIADWLITKALEQKYHHSITLEKLDDSLEWQAHQFIVNNR